MDAPSSPVRTRQDTDDTATISTELDQMKKFFISYAREDLQTAKRVAGELESMRYQVWWDRKMLAGADISNTIRDQIRSADKVVVIWSRYSVTSAWVKDEAGLAVQLEKYLPIRIDASQPPLGFGAFNVVDVHDWNADFKHLVRSLDPTAASYTVAYVVQEAHANPRQVSALLEGLDQSALKRSVEQLQRAGYRGLEQLLPQGQQLVQRLAIGVGQRVEQLLGDDDAPVMTSRERPGAGKPRPSASARGSLLYAPILRRFVAGLFDMFVIGILSSLIALPFATYDQPTGPSAWLFVPLWCLYGAALRGTTLGYRLTGLRLINAASMRSAGIFQAMASSVVSLFPAGFLWYFADRKKRMLQDIVSGSLAVRKYRR